MVFGNVVLFVIMLFPRLYVRFDISLPCGEHLPDRGEVHYERRLYETVVRLSVISG
jgi:hypothetical protein